jgi:hypothetical protein
MVRNCLRRTWKKRSDFVKLFFGKTKPRRILMNWVLEIGENSNRETFDLLEEAIWKRTSKVIE